MSTIVIIILIALAAASAAYGETVMKIKSGTRFFISWYVLAAVLLTLAIATWAGIWDIMAAWLKWLLGIIAVALLAVLVFLECLISTGFHAKGQDDLDYIIVLGAQVRESGPSLVLMRRLDMAVDYLAANPRTICIVTGGKGHGEPFSEAWGMAEYLYSRGVDRRRVLLEERAHDTSQNIKFSGEMIDSKNGRVGIITNNFHIYRSVHLARSAGFKNVCGIDAGSTPWYLANNMFREAFGVVKDLVSGNMKLFPVR